MGLVFALVRSPPEYSATHEDEAGILAEAANHNFNLRYVSDISDGYFTMKGNKSVFG